MGALKNLPAGVSLPSACELVATRLVRAPRERIFAAWQRHSPPFAGALREVDPPARLVFTPQKPGATLASLTLTTHGNTTTVTYTALYDTKRKRDAALPQLLPALTESLDRLERELNPRSETSG